MSATAVGGAKKPEPKKALLGIDNIMASIGAAGESRRKSGKSDKKK